MKLTKKQIEAIREHTPAELKGKQDHIRDELGYYMPRDANWSYRAGWNYSGVLIVTRFGEVM